MENEKLKRFRQNFQKVLEKLNLCHYRKSKVRCSETGNGFEVSLLFSLPHCSILKVVEFCELNNINMDYTHHVRGKKKSEFVLWAIPNKKIFKFSKLKKK